MEIRVGAAGIPRSEFTSQAGEAARFLKVMANERRLLILCYLTEAGELSASELMDHVELSQSALSQHLAKLREEGLVVTRKDAQSVFYRVSDPKAEQVLALLHQLYCPELGQGAKPVAQVGESA